MSEEKKQYFLVKWLPKDSGVMQKEWLSTYHDAKELAVELEKRGNLIIKWPYIDETTNTATSDTEDENERA